MSEKVLYRVRNVLIEPTSSGCVMIAMNRERGRMVSAELDDWDIVVMIQVLTKLAINNLDKRLRDVSYSIAELQERREKLLKRNLPNVNEMVSEVDKQIEERKRQVESIKKFHNALSELLKTIQELSEEI